MEMHACCYMYFCIIKHLTTSTDYFVTKNRACQKLHTWLNRGWKQQGTRQMETGACLHHRHSVNTTASSFIVCQNQYHKQQGNAGVRGCLHELTATVYTWQCLQKPMKWSSPSISLLSLLPIFLTQHLSHFSHSCFSIIIIILFIWDLLAAKTISLILTSKGTDIKAEQVA